MMNSFAVRIISLLWLLFFCACSQADNVHDNVHDNINDEVNKEALDLYHQAEHYFARGDFESAGLLYRQAVQINANDKVRGTEHATTSLLQPYGRNAIQRKRFAIEVEDYVPNQRLKEIARIRKKSAKAATPPKIVLRMASFADDTNDGVLNAGENAQLDFIVENRGESRADDVSLQLELDDSRLASIASSITVGNVEPHSLVMKRVTISGGERLEPGDMTVKTIAQERDGFDSKPLLISINTAEKLAPLLKIVEIRLEDQNSDAKVSAGEPVNLTAVVANIGKGMAAQSVVSVQLGNSGIIQAAGTNALLMDKINPGTQAEARFLLLTSDHLQDHQTVPIYIHVKNAGGEPLLTKRIEMQTVADPYGIHVVAKDDEILSFNGMRSDVDENIPVSAVKDEHAVAVVIGNRNYALRNMPAVKYALNDARAVKKYLINVLGYEEKNIIYLEDATAARFNETFGSESDPKGKLYNFVTPGQSDVFIYYSGHGAPDTRRNSAYFLPVDVDPNYIAASGYSLATFYKNIAKLPAHKVVVVLDTCFSGNSFGGFLLQGVSPAMLNISPMIPNYDNVVVFMSTGKDQVSAWYSDKNHGLYTYFFLKGLAGNADSDTDGVLTSAELGKYVLDKVPYMARRLNGNEQTPVMSFRKDYTIAHY